MSEETNERIIEFIDEETGEHVLFEHLDTVEHEGEQYFLLTEYSEEEPDPEESDVYVMRLVVDENGEETLEIVQDNHIIDAVFDDFKDRFQEEFEFPE